MQQRHYNEERDGPQIEFVGVIKEHLIEFFKDARDERYISQGEYDAALARIEAAQPSMVAVDTSEALASASVGAAAADGSAVSTVPSSNSENRSAAAENAEETPTTTPSDTAVSVVGKLEALTDLETWKKDAAREIERIGQVIKELYPRHQWLTKGKPSLLSKIKACDSLKADIKTQIEEAIKQRITDIDLHLKDHVGPYALLVTNVNDTSALSHFHYLKDINSTPDAFRTSLKLFIGNFLNNALIFGYISQGSYDEQHGWLQSFDTKSVARTGGNDERHSTSSSSLTTPAEVHKVLNPVLATGTAAETTVLNPSSDTGEVPPSSTSGPAHGEKASNPQPPVATNKPSLIGSGTLTLIPCGVTAMLVIGLDSTKPWQGVHNISQVTINQWELYILTFIALCISLYMTFNFVNDVKEQCCQSTAPAMPSA